MSDCLSVRLSHRFAGIITFTAMRASWVEKGGREDGAGGGKRVYPTATISTHFEMHERRGEWVQRSLKEREEWRERERDGERDGRREGKTVDYSENHRWTVEEGSARRGN